MVFFTNLSVMEFQVRCLALFLLFSLIDSWYWMGSLHNNAGVLQGSIVCPRLLLLYINDLLNDVISDVTIYDDDTTLF